MDIKYYNMVARRKIKTVLKLFFILFIISITISNCSKEKNNCRTAGLPDCTMEGKNTFGCYIDGDPWVSDEGFGFIEDLYIRYDEKGDRTNENYRFYLRATYVTADIYDDFREDFIFEITPLKNEGLIEFSNTIIQFRGSVENYNLDDNYNNYMTITKLDTINNICSGKFDFRLLNNSLTDTLIISEGRFDVWYIEY